MTIAACLPYHAECLTTGILARCGCSVDWTNKRCVPSSRRLLPIENKGVGSNPESNCPHVSKWFYTVNDAYNGLKCQVCGPGSYVVDDCVV